MPDSHSSRSESETEHLTLHVALCSECRQTADDDGGEYQATPEKAIEHVLAYHDWIRDEAGRLLCDECRPEETAADRQARYRLSERR